MNILKSLKKRIVVTLFFIFSFTFAILTFSIGNSAINEQRVKSKKYTKENNRMISFVECKNISINELTNILEEEQVTITLSNYDDRRGVEVVTTVQDKGIKVEEEMKNGNFYTEDEFKSNQIGGIFSNVLENKNISIYSSVEGQDININKDGIYYDTKAKIIVTNKTFEKLYSFEEPGVSNTVVIMSGKKDVLDNACKLIDKYIKLKDSKNNLLTFPYMIEDRSLEGEALYSATILIVVITIINSISICALWVESRKKELVLRKTFGASNRDIAVLFWGELLIISILSIFLALAIQYLLVIVTGGYVSNISIKLTYINFIYAIILSVFTSFVATLPLIRYLQKIQPVEHLREEG